jgi:hypothetical protein
MTFGIFLAALVLAGAIGFIAYYFTALRPRPGTLDWIAMADRAPFTLAHKRHAMARKDALPVLIITVVYAVTAFFSLGSTKAPQAYHDFVDGETVTIQVEGDKPLLVSRVWAYSSLGTGAYNLEVSADGEAWSTLWTKTEQDEWGRDKTVYYWALADGYDPSYALSQDYVKLFKWQDIIPQQAQWVRYIRITGKADYNQQTLRLGKLIFFDDQNQPLSFSWSLTDGETAPDGLAQLFTVDNNVPVAISWRNSSYFDEIYHPRTALEHLEGLNPYETTHPPLGKLILSIGIWLFGMTPFGWRFMGTLFGVLMLPLLYVFLKNMFGKTVVATCGTALFAAEFMHLAQTRIATIDTYGVFFILLSYWFFYRWLTASATPNKKGKTSEGYGSLALAGITWGIGCACKWTVIYAGVGLAVLYVLHLVLRALAWKRGEENAPSPAEPAAEPSPDDGLPLPAELSRVKTPRKRSLAGWLVKTLLLSVLCFVLIPLAIYTASYIPYALAQGNVGLSLPNTLSGFGRSFPVFWENLWGYLRQGKDFRGPSIPRDSLSGIMLHNQYHMLTYHNGVTTPHSYESRWYQWLVDGRPILFYLDDMGGSGMTERFASFNNPLISWAGLLSLIAVAIRFVQRKCGKALFLVVAFLSQLLPWVFIGRTTFAYHYFPSILFLVFCICYLFNDLMECQWAKWRLPVYGVTGVSIALYVLFYPALIGLTMPNWYSGGLLRFLPSWPF